MRVTVFLSAVYVFAQCLLSTRINLNLLSLRMKSNPMAISSMIRRTKTVACYEAENEHANGGIGDHCRLIRCLSQCERERASFYEVLFGLALIFSIEPVVGGNPSQTMPIYFAGILGFTPDLQGVQPLRNFATCLAALAPSLPRVCHPDSGLRPPRHTG